MKQNKTAILVVISVLLLSVLLYFVPIKNVFSRLPYINRFYNNTTLEITTPNSKANVWIEGKDYGETPVTVDDLPEGEYTIELEKITDEESFYKKQSFIMTLTRNTTSRLDVEIGPEDLLHGTIMYYTELKSTSGNGMLTVLSEDTESKVFLDEELLTNTPITNYELPEKEYDVKVVKNGYENIEVPIIIRNDYSLVLKTYQMPIPVIFETNTNE